METDSLNYFDNLQRELDDAKSSLVQLNDNIRRIIGRRPEKSRTASEHKQKPNAERALQKSSVEVSKFKKRNNDAKSVFNRLSAATVPPSNTDDDIRPRLTSRVIREMPTRQEVVAAQGIDSESRARNRRIFGSLLGTLQKFCQEESKLKDKEQKKADIEKKLEEQQRQERANLRKERESLFMDRKLKHMQIKALEMKMQRIKEYETWESSVTHLKNFIRTKCKPHIYYKPRSNMCKKLEKLHEKSKTQLMLEIENKRQELNKELSEIETNVKMENMDAMDEHMDEDECMENQEEKSKNRLSEKHTEPKHKTYKNGCLENQNKSRNNEYVLSSRVVVVASHKETEHF